VREQRNAHRLLVGKPQGKRPLGTPRHRWGDNIKMDLKEILWEDPNWIHVAWHRDKWWALKNMVMDLQVP